MEIFLFGGEMKIFLFFTFAIWATVYAYLLKPSDFSLFMLLFFIGMAVLVAVIYFVWGF